MDALKKKIEFRKTNDTTFQIYFGSNYLKNFRRGIFIFTGSGHLRLFLIDNRLSRYCPSARSSHLSYIFLWFATPPPKNYPISYHFSYHKTPDWASLCCIRIKTQARGRVKVCLTLSCTSVNSSDRALRKVGHKKRKFLRLSK